jgi:hypothetical protein
MAPDDQGNAPNTDPANVPAAGGGAVAVATEPPQTGEQSPQTAGNGATATNGAGATVVTVPVSPNGVDTVLKLGPDTMSRAEPANGKGFRAALLNSALVDLSLAAIVTIAVYIIGIGETTGTQAYVAVAAGVVTAILVGLVYSRRLGGQAAPDQTNPDQYGELQERWTSLAAHLETLCPEGKVVTADQQIACTEARDHRDYIACELGISTDDQPRKKSTGTKWVVGSGFIDIWRRLHDAEQGLFLVESPEQLVANGLYDELRLINSGIKNETDLLKRLRGVLSLLGGKKLLVDATDVPDFTDADPGVAKAGAPLLLADVRQAINQFRDESREGVIRARNHLIWTGMITALLAFALLDLAVLYQTPVASIVGGGAFFLIGAVVGLFAQLRNSSSEEVRSGDEDFGLRRARLIYAPVLSGLAALGGVLVMATLYPVLNQPLQVAADQASFKDIPIPALQDIFNIEKNQFGVLVAAVFGLTPDLLINRLQGEADRYKVDLQNSSVQTRTT